MTGSHVRCRQCHKWMGVALNAASLHWLCSRGVKGGSLSPIEDNGFRTKCLRWARCLPKRTLQLRRVKVQDRGWERLHPTSPSGHSCHSLSGSELLSAARSVIRVSGARDDNYQELTLYTSDRGGNRVDVGVCNERWYVLRSHWGVSWRPLIWRGCSNDRGPIIILWRTRADEQMHVPVWFIQ